MTSYYLPATDCFQDKEFEDFEDGFGFAADGDLDIIKLELNDESTAPVVSHRRPHLDELCAMWLMKKYASGDFVQQHLDPADGMIKLGVGHGKFDEHQANGKRMAWDCCATLVAKALGVFEDPCLKKILLYVRHRDAHAGAHPMEIEPLVKLLHRAKLNTLEILAWVETSFDALYEEQMIFLTEGRKAFEAANTIIKEVVGPNGKSIKLAVVHSESELVSKYARAEIGGNCGVVIQVYETGHVVIFGSKRHGINLVETIQILRYKEQQVKGKIVVTDWRELVVPGKNPAIDEWYLLGGGVILNSSLTVPDVPATEIPLKHIVHAVEVGINPRAFYHKNAEKCRNGWCVATRAFPCPWYNWHIQRCREARQAKYQKIKEKEEANG